MLKRYLALFRALNAARIKYLVIGGLAVIAHGIPRSTKDADLALLPSPKTYAKLVFGKVLLDVLAVNHTIRH